MQSFKIVTLLIDFLSFPGNKKHADDLQIYLSSRDLFNMKLEFQVGNGKVSIPRFHDNCFLRYTIMKLVSVYLVFVCIKLNCYKLVVIYLALADQDRLY